MADALRHENDHPGCMQSLLHFLDLHQRLRIRKTLAYRRSSSAIVAFILPAGVKSPKKKQNSASVGDDQNSLDKDEDLLIKNKENSGGRSSPNALMKSLISRRRSREKDKKQNTSPSSSQMQRTLSIHHLESDDYVSPDEQTPQNGNFATELTADETECSSTNEAVPALPMTSETATVEKQSRFGRSKSHVNWASRHQLVDKELNEARDSIPNGLGRDASLYKSKEFMEMLQLFSENKELFLKFLQDPTFIFTDYTQEQQASIPAMKLTKSGSFPAAGWSHRNRPLSLDDKQEETGSIDAPSSTCNAVEDAAHSMESMAHPDAANMLKAESEALDCAELGFAETKNTKNVGNVSTRFKVLKQKIKYIIKENKKEHQRISMDSILHKIPYGEKVSENVKKEAEGLWHGRLAKSISRAKKIGLPSSSSKHTIRSIRKSSSLTESLGRYSQLLEYVSSTESKRSPDMSMMFKEDTDSLRQKTPKVLKRIFSLPELPTGSASKDLRNEVSNSQLLVRPTSRAVARSSSVKTCDTSQVDSVAALTADEQSIEPEKLVEHSLEEDVSGIPVETEEPSVPIDEQEQSIVDEDSFSSLDGSKILVTDSNVQEDATSPTGETPHSEAEESELMTIPEADFGMDASLTMENVEQKQIEQTPTQTKLSEFSSFHIQVHEGEEAEFEYVRNILMMSGFSSEEAFGEWHLPDQPVDPSLFEDSLHDLETAAAEPDITLKHMLLFDLINEVLLETYDTSFAYCPWVLHADCQIRPLPVGHRVLEEVWAVISKHLSYQLLLDQTVESTVARDFTRNDGWMNLQYDTEYVALDLEDLLLEDLIDEIVLEFADLSCSGMHYVPYCN
ncbi:Myb-like DNA-binding domain [Musa troglodytarum]|uniref:Myb-like DNA-binding domain n=1 Tax=Musa troglodytarum TaxID=320322 RepID=A0A9E7KED6_9LILI|nr:Myb-like DNA-binding domain [Musa troglodytarum]